MKNKSDVVSIIICGLFFLWVAWGIFALVLLADGQNEKVGLFGDFYGGLNTLVSILGFAAIVYTIQKGREDGEGERERHLQNLKLQGEMLEAQRGAAIWQEKQARLATVAANLEAHSTTHRNTYADKETNQKFIRDHGETLIAMTSALEGISFGSWLDERMEKAEKDVFCFACIPIGGELDFSEQTVVVSKSILASWDTLGASIKREAQIAHEFKSHYFAKLIDLGDIEIKEKVLLKFGSINK